VFRKSSFTTVLLVGLASFVFACSPEQQSNEPMLEAADIEQSQFALSSDTRTRVVQEASFAMVGNYNTYTSGNWPTADTLATYYYTLTDLGAWNKLLAEPYYGPNAYYVSCRRKHAEAQLYICRLPPDGFGSLDMPYYTCQGLCPAQKMRGGQCLAFSNLIAYRSGVYQGANYAWKLFPSDATMDARAPDNALTPMATYANILPGDFLRKTHIHSLIVVRKISSTQVVVFDSNWVGNGNGDETVGSHTFGFTGSGGSSDLGTYRVMKCIHNGGC
jgi:hypothetical protein